MAGSLMVDGLRIPPAAQQEEVPALVFLARLEFGSGVVVTVTEASAAAKEIHASRAWLMARLAWRLAREAFSGTVAKTCFSSW
jgi:hypothetical protein